MVTHVTIFLIYFLNIDILAVTFFFYSLNISIILTVFVMHLYKYQHTFTGCPKKKNATYLTDCNFAFSVSKLLNDGSF